MKQNKIAIFHHFLLSHCKGGGEKLMLQLREHLGADFWCGAIDLDGWDPSKCTDSFTEDLGKANWHYLHEESQVKGWKYIKRQIAYLLSPQIRDLAQNDIVIFSFGNIAFVPQRVKKINPYIKTIAYVHTPPRIFTDQYDSTYNNLKWYAKPFFSLFTKLVLWNFNNALESCDVIIANSENIKSRLLKYCKIDANKVIFPLVETEKFYNKPSKNFYLSHARLEPLKRIDIIVKAFEQMPEQKLVITSGGPMTGWVKEYILNNNITNIEFKGRVSDAERDELMATCTAGIYIPIDEDAGITQLEFMACGKPVIGVKDGGLIESIIDGKTGILMSKNVTQQEIISTIRSLEPKNLEDMKQACINQSKLFDKTIFFNKFDEIINEYS